MSLVVNKHKVYTYEERAFESFGNILSLKTISYKNYCKVNLMRIPRYSYFLSSKCIEFFIQESFEDKLDFVEWNKLKEKKFLLNEFFDLLTLDDHLLNEHYIQK